MKYVVKGIRAEDGREVELARTWSAVEAWEAYRHWTKNYTVYSRVFVLEPWWARLF